MSSFREKAKILDSEGIEKVVIRLAHEIVEKNQKDLGHLVLIGVMTRGVILAQRLSGAIRKMNDTTLTLGALDITLYRDDLTQVAQSPVVHETRIDFDITDRKVILVDDVLFTGRTVRCALDELIDFGRPRTIQLAVLIDRGHRDLPIRADYVGKNLPTSLQEIVQVRFQETDGVDEVVIEETER
ncbi:MAG: bifunctional pyr operon transcriptional regulator/uracil phosphoribosyltransferase PyrR [Candidatus Omnitrophica bacterium]|nr:bifunctional pyr operon transcriptional regulator/uracil phosphoribosyltransferase PyrR [Candidatus Omnitrophota bacterium]